MLLTHVVYISIFATQSTLRRTDHPNHSINVSLTKLFVGLDFIQDHYQKLRFRPIIFLHFHRVLNILLTQ